MENEELTTFSLEDNPDEEVIEEQVIDRDEEYEDDDYDDEDEEYDDEDDYDDEEDDYDDEEEDYDDGYNDDYYDDRLDKVLDEIAEIKRGMSTPAPAAQQQPSVIFPPSSPYIYAQPSSMGPVPASSEVVMYNEISRLRDEIAKNQSSLEMQKELSRIKDDMARDQRFAESQYNAEIKRLQDRIDDLLKNAESSQGELPPAQNQVAQLESGKSNSSLDFDRLLSMNESILRTTCENDARLQNEISHLRTKVESMPSAEELNRAVSALKRAANNSENLNSETLNKLSAEIASLRAAIGDGKAAGMPVAPVVVGGADSGDVDASELLRQLYEIRNVLGSSSSAAVARTQVVLDLIVDYRKVAFDVSTPDTTLKDKLTSVYNYVKKLEESNEPDAIDLIESTNEIIQSIAVQRLDKKSFADLSSYLAANGSPVPTQIRDAADKFFGICDKIAALDKFESLGDYLPDLIAERNNIENGRHKEQNANALNEITTALLAEKRDDDAIKEKLAQLTTIVVSDVAELPLIDIPKNYMPVHSIGDETLFSKLAELKSAFDEAFAHKSAGEEAQADVQEQDGDNAVEESGIEEPVIAEEGDGEVVATGISLQDVYEAVDDLRATLAQTTGVDGNSDISSMLEEVRNNYIDLSERLIEISNIIVAQNDNTRPEEDVVAESDGSSERVTDVLSDEQKQKAIEDLEYIRSRLDQQEAFLNQIADVRNDIQNISANVDLTDQIASVTNEIAAQFDKLYEDLSNVIIESEANITSKLFEPTVVADFVEAAKADIIADTQEIKDTLALISDSVGGTAVLDAIDGLRNDLASFVDLTAANTDVSSADRQRLLDDVAYLREQATASSYNSTVNNTSAVQATDKIYAYLDDITARVEALVNVPDDVLVAKETLNVIAEDTALARESASAALNAIAPITDQLNVMAVDTASTRDAASAAFNAIAPITDQLNVLATDTATTRDAASAALNAIAPITDQLSVISDDTATTRDAASATLSAIAPINDQLNVIADDTATTRDAASAALNALAPITDQLNAILDKLAEREVAEQSGATSEQSESALTEDLSDIKSDLTTILDTLPLLPQSDDLVTARDNTYSILDTLTMMPQNDDIVATRDNVAAVLDGVNSLGESIKAISEAQQNNASLADDMAVVIDNTSAMLDSLASLAQTQEDVQYIRQKLDEQPANVDADADSVGDIMQDLGLVLDKLEAFEQSFATDKQDILDAVAGVREEIHINELDENMAASGIDDETRDILVSEIADIRDRLGNIENSTSAMGDVNGTALDSISAQLADIQNALAVQSTSTATVDNDGIEAVLAELADIKDRLDGGVTVAGATGDGATSAASDSLQAIADELAAIREKVETESEYDTIEEILSLRDDVKAARIVDQNEVSGELESIKNELAAISSGNILDEIRALRDDIAAVSLGGEAAAAPTNEELNLVLNEIVSLRDEMFAFKDEVRSATSAQHTVDGVEDREEADGEVDDDITAILDELTALRADQTTLTDNIDELKDIISRRTTISPDTDEQEAVASASNELNVVLGEIIDLKNNFERVEENLESDRLNLLTEQIEEIRTIVEDLRSGAPIADSNVAADGAQPVQSGVADDIAELRAEIELLRSENEILRRENADMVTNGFNELREAIRDMALSSAPTVGADGDTSYAALIDEIRSLKAEVAESKAASQSVGLDEETIQSIKEALGAQTETAMPISEELNEIRDEIAQLRSLTTVSVENSGAVEIAAIKDEIAQLKDVLSSPESIGNIAEDVTSIRADVQAIKDEPDLGVLNEILALRDEFQKLREQIEDVKEIASKTDEQSDEAILNEVQSLRDQIFAISMANVNDASSGESNYESYNNLILDELASLREQASNAGSDEELKAVLAEIQNVKAALEKRENLYDTLAKRVEKLDNDATNNKILEELASLRTELANQRDADLTTINFMSEMAHLLERQNNYISQNAGTKISDEIESLKAEIASTDAVAEEIAKLRDIMTRSGNASDNDTILNELGALREELSAEKPSKENELILEEIARLRDELMTLKDREQDHSKDSDLKDTLSDLKDQLNEIAEIVEPAEKAEKTAKPATATKKPATKSSSGSRSTAKKPTAKKPATKSSSGSKSTAKKPAAKKPAAKRTTSSNKVATPTATVTEQPEEVIAFKNPHQPVERDEVDFDIKFGDEIAKLTSSDSDMSLNPQGPISSDAMDVADKLAKQVANKLVMEQLVEQLGDGGVSDERVDEILRDILPQEFTTVALNEQSDKVRKLANRLVLNKLRDRLGGRVIDEDDD